VALASAYTVLVVDDHEDNRALARAALEDDDYRVITASGGEQAVALAAAERPDCILMDVRMPQVDGIAACERIRALPGGSDIAIIFVTAQREVEVFDRALKAGGDDFITKPFRPTELALRVQTALRLRHIAIERSELVSELKHQRDALQRVELQKEQLIAFLVHDLKNPVNAIDLHAQLVERRAADEDRARTAAIKIREETRALLRMITNLLDISMADEGRLAPVIADCDLGALVQELLDELNVSAARVGVTIETDLHVTRLRSDRDLLSRVLANLLDNAIRHAPESTSVRVAIVPAGEDVDIQVADVGPGVPPEHRESVFDRFRSGGDFTNRSNRGLGLAFCKLAVEALGGTIRIEDGSPGAVFRVKLPRDERRN
jgi:two-component system, sensor histidine kinase and response regulator